MHMLLQNRVSAAELKMQSLKFPQHNYLQFVVNNVTKDNFEFMYYETLIVSVILFLAGLNPEYIYMTLFL